MRFYPCAVAVLLSVPVFAQDKPPAAPYQVEFTIHDASDASPNKGIRHYTMQLDNNSGRGTIRAGSKIAYPTSTFTSAGNTNVQTQYNYADVGASIDCRLTEKDGRLLLWTSVDLSTVTDLKANMPIIGQSRSEVSTVVTPGKSATLMLIDDPQLQRKLRVDALVTAAK